MSARMRQSGSCVSPYGRGRLFVPLLAALLVLTGPPQLARGRSLAANVNYEDGGAGGQVAYEAFTRRLLQGPFLGCPPGTQRCPSGIPECIPLVEPTPDRNGKNGVCNGIVECSDGSDEAAERCQGGCSCPGCYRCRAPVCHAKCPSGACTNTTVTSYSPKSDQNLIGDATPWLCDGKPDCVDGSDEAAAFCKSYDCSKSTIEGQFLGGFYTNEYTSCPGGAGYCLLKASLCDGKRDCSDGSDEAPAFCSAVNCTDAGGRTKCPSGVGCVSEFLLCNGVKDCPDGSDEDVAFCTSRPCPQGLNKCPSGGGCITPYAFCNGVKDCLDGSEEDLDYCRNVHQCPASANKCPGGAGCYSYKGQLCDGKPNCADGSDEDPAFCASFDCTDSFNPSMKLPRCPSGVGCLRYGAVCNGVKECLDNSDEENCSAANCTSTAMEPRVWCENDKKCTVGVICDGVVNCADGSDESPAACVSLDSCPSTGANPPLQRCSDKSNCLNAAQFCDGVRDCTDGSDEQPGSCKDVKCSDTGRETCPSGVGCLKSKTQICDGIFDCIDGSDEQDCTADKCVSDPGRNRIFCPKAKKCAFGYFCDSVTDCSDETDEDPAFCSTQSCPNKFGSQFVKCPGGVSCAAPDAFCNLRKDCANGTEEDPGFCASYDCSTTGRSKCPGNKQCISGDGNAALCNGYADCRDKSDEDPALCASFDCAANGRGRCPSGTGCLPGYATSNPGEVLCNGQNDCLDGSDEAPAFCKGYTCQATSSGLPRFKCPGNGTQCVLGSQLCSGFPGSGCKDGSDNAPGTCADVDCAKVAGPDYFKCPGRAMCAQGGLCDGLPNCPFGEDEDPALCNGGNPGSAPPGTSPPGSGNPSSTPPVAGPRDPPANPPSGSGNPTSNPPLVAPSGPPANPPSVSTAATSAALPTSTQAAGGTTTTVPASTACPAVDGVPTNSCFNRGGTAHVCCVSPDSCGPFTPSGDATCANGNYFTFGAPPAGAPAPPQTITLVAAGVPCPVCRGAPSNSCFNADGTGHVCCINPDTCLSTGPSCTNGNAVQFTGAFGGPVTATNC